MENIHWYEVEQCEANRDIKQFRNFEDIPKERLSESSLVAWIVSGSGKLAKIPVEERTERLLWSAVRHDKDAYDLIPACDVNNHRELSLEALRHSNTYFSSIPEAYKDEQFLIDMTERGSHSIKNIGLADRYDHLLTDFTAMVICSRSVSQALSYCEAGGEKARALLKDEYVLEAIKKQTSDFGSLKSLGKEYLLISLLADGFWPAEENFNFPPEVHALRSPPSSPKEAVERYSVATALGHKVLHRCWLQAQPKPQVIDELQSFQKGLDELFIIYPEHELREYMKSYRSIRGRLLEQDLGM